MYALYAAVRYVASAKVGGALVECGVWKGGSAMLMAQILVDLCEEKEIYLYDTFEGMSEPTDSDVDLSGNTAAELLREGTRSDPIWAYAGIDEVKANLAKTGYPTARIRLIKGKVEDTMPGTMPDAISLLRLDTDWYDSTYHELVHLFPRVVPGGVLIIDDYGHWQGARLATDRYLRDSGVNLLLNRIDYSGRIAIKPRA
jgi:hypothetical protein